VRPIEAIYSFSRPDLPGELGALKIFSFRENSGLPVDRLQRKIEILKEGRPNLPQLLDSNVDNLWMITVVRTKSNTLIRHRLTNRNGCQKSGQVGLSLGLKFANISAHEPTN
jgi:hypothetical protein